MLMSPMNYSSWIPFIIGMSEQSDRTSLISQLIISINKLTNATESRLLDFISYDLHNTNPLTGKNSNTSGTELLDPLNHISLTDTIEQLNEFLTKKLQNGHTVLIQNGRKKRSFYLLTNATNSYSILLLDHPLDTDFNPKIVSFFLKLYQNLQKNIQAKDQDPLTGLFNRRSFDETISHILDHAIYGVQPNRSPADGACLAIFDIDFFKRINDNYGHAIGDEVLILFARLMESVFRKQDRLYRFGGEEFIAILTEVDVEKANYALERFRQQLELYPFPQTGTVTVSIGATMVNQEDFPPVLIEKADKALYFAKENGRNQIHFHEHLVAKGLLDTTDHTSDDNIELWD